MIFGAFAIFFTGYPHVWSIYQPYVMEQAGWSQGQASMCFYLALSTFVFGNIVGGRMQNHFKEKTIVWIGGGIFAAGILASAFLIVPTPVPMYLTYGVMQGFGQGMIYTVILATVQRWLPDRTGFASGVVVTANGLCGFFLAPLSRKLLEAEGVQKTLLIVGVAITVSWILCGIFFQAPEKSLINAGGSGVKAGTPEVKQYTSGEMMRTKNFYLLLATMFFGLTSYFMVSPVSQTYQIDLGIPSAVAVSAVMLGSIVVKAGGDYDGVKGLSDLAGTGCKVTTQLGTGWVPLLDQIEGAEQSGNYETTSECFMAISNGVADVCVVDLPTAESAVLTNKDLKIIKLDDKDTFSGDDEMVNVCIATRKGDTELRDKLQGAMDDIGWNDKEKMDELMDTVLTQQPAAN